MNHLLKLLVDTSGKGLNLKENKIKSQNSTSTLGVDCSAGAVNLPGKFLPFQTSRHGILLVQRK